MTGFTFALVTVVPIYICLIVLGSVNHHRERFDRFVAYEVAALVLCIITTMASFIWAEGLFTPSIWVLNSGLQAFRVRQARKYRREWLSWQDPHSGHVCNEDCPGWTGYAGARS